MQKNSSTKYELLSEISKINNVTYRIGITGPPGAGKSSITNQLIKYYRKANKSVAVLLVDPSSPFTKGALLGDRIRVNSHFKDNNVFVRSLASRESKGGLTENISEISYVLEKAGFEIIIYETVGVGQIEIDIVEEVDSVVLVLVPESGDDIQMMKAGVLEIADIFLINKFDRKDSSKLYAALKNILSFSMRQNDSIAWKHLILKTVATENKGIDKLYDGILKHQKYANKNKIIQKHNVRYKNTFDKLLNEYLKKKYLSQDVVNELEKELLKDKKNQQSPYEFFKNKFVK